MEGNRRPRSVLIKNSQSNLLIATLCILLSFLQGAQSSSCYIFGTEHVYTFDGQAIDFSTDLELLAAQTCPPSVAVPAQFSISIINEYKYMNIDSASQVKCVKVIYKSFVTRMCADQSATVNGDTVIDSTLLSNGQLMVYYGTSGRELAIQIEETVVRVTITPSSSVTINLPDIPYSNNLCGLCGDLDGDATNDLMLANGTDLSNSQLTQYERGAVIAESYLTGSGAQTGSVGMFVPSYCVGDSDEEGLLSAQDLCGIYEGSSDIFSACRANTDLTQTFLDLCIYDYCENYLLTDSADETTSACEDSIPNTCVRNETIAKAAVNNVAEVYADICKAEGFQASTSWRTDYGAELTCSSGTFTTDGPYCPNVCGLLSDRCAQTGVEGCECPSGQWKEGDTCVASSSCGCSDANTGEYYAIGQTWIDNLCTTEYRCDATNTISATPLLCADISVCTSEGCECPASDGYIGDGTVCELSCDTGSEPVADVCTECAVGTYKAVNGTDPCTACPEGQITDLTGSTTAADCKDITMAPEASNAVTYKGVADESFQVIVPTNVLPDGLPVGIEFYRNVWVSTNGLVSFGESFVGRTPGNLEDVPVPIVAPFWLRQDLRIPEGITRPSNTDEALTVSVYNTLDPDQAFQEEATNSLKQIKILLDASEGYRALSASFDPSYAVVVCWKNTSPNPAVFYSGTESIFYQAVIVSNGIRTYTIFIYPSGGITINPLYRRPIYMGFNAKDGGAHEYNYYKSNTAGILNLDSEPSNTDVNGRWVFELANLGADNPDAQACQDWWTMQKFYMFPFGLPFDLGIPCPCNLANAVIDENFFFDYQSDCAVSLYRDLNAGFYQRCCYDTESTISYGALITDPVEAGFPSFWNPLLTYNLYERVDLTPYTQCCRSSQYCDLFREFRPVQRCDGYVAPTLSCGFGDPHIYTLDGDLYTYNPIGEFWMILSDQFSMQARMIQALDTGMELVPATQFGAFAMQSISPVNSSAVHVEINNNRTDFEVRVNGDSISNRIDADVVEQVIAYDDGDLVLKKFNSSISVSFRTGYSFRFSLRLNILSIQSFVPESAKGNVNGLLGRFDGDASNDLTTRDGELVCVLGYENCTIETIHTQFGETWRLQDGESLFWYRPGWNSATYTDKAFSPVFDLPTNQTLTDLCNNDFQCMFDIFMTNDTAVGQDTAATLTEVNEKASTLGTAAPIVVGPSRYNVSVNTLFNAVYTVNYTGNYTVVIEALSKPADATFTADIDGTSYVFEWTPTDLTDHSIQLVAKETDRIDGTNAVSPIFEVSVRLSPECVNGGAAYERLAVMGQLTSLFSIVECDCDPGWTSVLCDVDYNGCVDNPCAVGECVDVPAATYDPVNGTTYSCNITECPTGYERITINGALEPDCTDINECLNSTTCVNADCSNTEGSFTCSCMSGYRFVANSASECENIDECETATDRCQHTCIDNDGGYTCDCNQGYSLMDDGYCCEADNATAELCALANCSFACINDGSGTVNCTCARGQRLNANGRTCDLIDECTDGIDACDDATNSTCFDLDIGYDCRCPDMGYRPLVNNYDPCIVCEVGTYGHDCNETCMCGDRARQCDPVLGCIDCNAGWEGEQCATDIDECLQPNACGPDANCTNTPGSYYCKCPDGYTNLNFTHCEDINECQSNNPCSKLATCNNTAGSYECTCEAGYTGSGILCSDINECSPTDGSPGPCVDIATCKNEAGSFQCLCEQGYHGNGKTSSGGCNNDNECVQASNVCGGYNNECADTEGSYVCRCLPGYNGDGVDCSNIDECTDNIFNCTLYDVTNGYGECTDNNGSYSCATECNEGYNKTIENSGEITCSPIDECSVPDTCDVITEICVDIPGSYRCDCRDGYNSRNNTCLNVNECVSGTHDCVDPRNGQSICEDTPGSFSCRIACDTGYEESVDSDITTCEDIDECLLGLCDAVTEDCGDTEGSYVCSCKDGYTDDGLGTCVDINECLNADACGGNGTRICVNLVPDYSCSCRYGYEGDTCETQSTNAEFIAVEQIFTLAFQEAWADTSSPDFVVFESLMSAALAPMFDSNDKFLGVNILSVSLYEANSTGTNRKKRQTTDSGTSVSYDAVFSDNVDDSDIIHQALDYLVSNNYMLDFNSTQISDLLMIAYPGVFSSGEVTCDTTITIDGVTSPIIDCQGRGVCSDSSDTDYPMCVCDMEYTGYNCGSESGVITETTGNLLALWISVAVAGALLLGGLLACTMVLVYQRRQRAPPLHRYPRAFSTSSRGPALFNPTSRMPAEAFNYQFPVGSVRDDLSDSSSTISATTTRTQRTEGRVGSTVPFAPRWPRAYYAQLGDPDDK